MTLIKIYFDLFCFCFCPFFGSSKGQITETAVNNSYNNDSYYIGSGEQPNKMKRDNARDVKPQEECYATIHNPPVSSTNHSAVSLTFPHATAENSSQGSTASIYQPLNDAAATPVYQPDAVHIYQSLNSDPEVRADSNTEGAMPSPPTKQPQ